VTNTIFGRWELAVADNVYIRNGSRSNISVQTYSIHVQHKQQKLCLTQNITLIKFASISTCFSIRIWNCFVFHFIGLR
jgi:hypothetical protein